MTDLFDGMAAVFRDTFGEAVTWTRPGGPPVELQGVVYLPSLTVPGLSEIDLVTTDPSLHCAVADLPAGYDAGDAVVARGVAYIVKGPAMPDGFGMVRFLLKRA